MHSFMVVTLTPLIQPEPRFYLSVPFKLVSTSMCVYVSFCICMCLCVCVCVCVCVCEKALVVSY